MAGTVFITGATGFLGCWITKRFLENGWRVGGIDLVPNMSRVEQVLGRNPAGVRWMTGNIAKADEVASAMAALRPDVIVHLAAALIPDCRNAPAAAADVNVTGYINVFEAARQQDVPRVIYSSSVAAGNRAESGALSTTYGTFKLWNEEFAATFFDQHRVSSLGLRPDVVYGPGRASGETSFVNAAIADAAKGVPHCIKRCWTARLEYVEEVAEAFYRCAISGFTGAHRSDVTAQVSSEDDLARALERVVSGARITCDPSGARLVSPPADLAFLQSTVGKLSQTSLEEGIRRTIAMMRMEKLQSAG